MTDRRKASERLDRFMEENKGCALFVREYPTHSVVEIHAADWFYKSAPTYAAAVSAALDQAEAAINSKESKQ